MGFFSKHKATLIGLGTGLVTTAAAAVGTYFGVPGAAELVQGNPAVAVYMVAGVTALLSATGATIGQRVDARGSRPYRHTDQTEYASVPQKYDRAVELAEVTEKVSLEVIKARCLKIMHAIVRKEFEDVTKVTEAFGTTVSSTITLGAKTQLAALQRMLQGKIIASGKIDFPLAMEEGPVVDKEGAVVAIKNTKTQSMSGSEIIEFVTAELERAQALGENHKPVITAAATSSEVSSVTESPTAASTAPAATLN